MSGADQLLDGLLALVEVALGLDLGRLQLRARELGQLRHARLQRLGAERLERGRQPLLGVGDRRQPLLRERPLVLEVGARADQLALELDGARRLGGQRAQPQRAAPASTAPAPRIRPINNQRAFITRSSMALPADGTGSLQESLP